MVNGIEGFEDELIKRDGISVRILFGLLLGAFAGFCDGPCDGSTVGSLLKGCCVGFIDGCFVWITVSRVSCYLYLNTRHQNVIRRITHWHIGWF